MTRTVIRLGVGVMLAGIGLRRLLQPRAFIGVGLIPATDPRTVRAFGIFIFVIGLLDVGLGLTQLLSE
ncbi:MAG: hypothetical protein QM688_12515 [Sphingomonas bacterium]